MAMTQQQLQEAVMQFYLHPVTNVRSTYKASVRGVFLLVTDPTRYKGITMDLRSIKAQQKMEADEGRETEAADKAREAAAFKKQNFDTICVSGLFSKRADNCLTQHSHLMGVDIDHYGEGRAVEKLKQEIIHDPMFREDFELELAFRSPSGDGLKLIVQTDLTQATHEEYFDALSNIFLVNYGIEIDANCKNVSRGCFLPYDPWCYVNPLVCPF